MSTMCLFIIFIDFIIFIIILIILIIPNYYYFKTCILEMCEIYVDP